MTSAGSKLWGWACNLVRLPIQGDHHHHPPRNQKRWYPSASRWPIRSAVAQRSSLSWWLGKQRPVTTKPCPSLLKPKYILFSYIYIYSLLYVSGLMITKLFFSTYWNPPRGQLLCSRDSNPNLVLEGMPLQQQRLPWRVAMPRLWVSQIRTSRITQSCSNHLQRTWPMLKLLLLRSMAPLKASSWQLSLGLVPIWIQVIPTEN